MKTKYHDKLQSISKQNEDVRQIVLAAFLAQLFKKKNVDLVVVGGAAVQFYTQSGYVTKDLDVILRGDTQEIIETIMLELGFQRKGLYRHFEHASFNFVVEFPPSPIEVAGRVISNLSVIETPEGPVQVIRIEDIMMDRITAAVEWKDESSLEQAKLLWIKHKDIIDAGYLIDFAKEEGYLKTLKEVMREVA